MNSAEKGAVLHCLKSMIDEEVCEECPLYGMTGTDHCEKDCIRLVINALEKEPCDDVCEWFEQYVDIATDIVELRFSDGTVKRAKRGLYMRDIEKSIRKMLIDQIANEKKQEPKWIPVSERLPESCGMYIVTRKIYDCPDTEPIIMSDESWFDGQNTWHNDNRINHKRGYLSDVIAWMPLPEPYKQEVEE